MVATFFFGGSAACGTVPFVADDPPPATVSVEPEPEPDRP